MSLFENTLNEDKLAKKRNKYGEFKYPLSITTRRGKIIIEAIIVERTTFEFIFRCL